MSSTDESRQTTLLVTTICQSALPFLVFPLLAGSALALAVSYSIVTWQLGTENYRSVFPMFSDAALVSGALIGFSAAFGLFAFVRIAKRLTKPLTSMAATAAELTRKRSTTRFDTSSDVTEMVQIGTELNRLYKAMDDQIEELGQLAQNVMHDVRNPLEHIMIDAQGILRNEAKLPDAAVDMMENCELISDIVEDHIQFAELDKISAERIPMKEIDLTETLLNARDLYSAQASDSGIFIETDFPPDAVTLTASERLLKTVIDNLIDNAIKYTPRGGTITLSARLVPSGPPEGDTSPSVTLSVTDTGTGIAPEDLPKIFDPHFRAKTSKGRIGSGLGLPRVKKIVELHEGKITASSVLGQGTTFTVTLPQRVTR